ncbi:MULTISPECIES: cysteine desulfurase family protein [unclassified Paenibacillus]|uniref:cysteine desulfurase family protein n=1 Tax=unclassified Paenibacillus TaxID=185978 RepID=UPI001C11CE30|nr:MULTISPECIES: cysteine desulfurase family protein [unclassified Paenibacillus]MBU5442612.1 cysteine desulfurase [Paenibacillus sp. MSJ-34]CAH0119066.1 Cysteine desulfurase IscS [Paenibacillus sp. CECT 9249]
MAPIYLDHSASTPMHPEVIEAMLAYMRDHYGNASSVHSFGRAAKRALSEARDQIAQQLHCQSNELVFTGGGTESDNTALFGAASAMRGIKKHIITSSVEHHAVLHTCNQLERMGYEVSFVSVDSTGQVDVNEIEAAIRPDTFLISIMYGNNEVGTLQPIEPIGELARARGILFHVDAVQALGMTRLDLDELPVDLMSFSSHKINGPQGVGALYVSRRANIDPLLFGGLQERKRRAGTENIAGIIGFAKAVQLVASNIAEHARHLTELREAMLRLLRESLGADRVVVNGHPTEHLPHILNVSFPDVPTETMLMNLDMEGIAASSGSACTSGSLEVSHVLVAMKLPEPVLRSAVRFSFGLGNTMKDVEIAAQKIATIVERIRKKN